MPSCVACGAELEPPVRIPHTVYVRSLYRIAGQDYCRASSPRSGPALELAPLLSVLSVVVSRVPGSGVRVRRLAKR